MSDTGKQSPLGVNVLGSLLQNIGMGINPQAESSMGVSSTTANYTLGTICNNTCIRLLTYAINDAYTRGPVDSTTYANLISIGAGVIPALGNSPPATYTWTGVPGWNPYTGVITSWGYIKLFALQAHDEFNYNETLPEYRDFLGSMNTAYSFVEYSNNVILTVENSKTFLEGTYSNMNDLISADIAGVTLATVSFGQDFIATGKALDLATISTFGLPSNLLATLKRYNAMSSSVTLALLSTGMTTTDINDILNKVNPVTTTQERCIYSAFSIIMGPDLSDVCITLNCKTAGLSSLADLLNPQKLFPNSYSSLTVPVYNARPTPTNSKTYYPIYKDTGVNIQLLSLGHINFGTHLVNILPEDVAIAAGAFSATMQQIRNIASVPTEKFAQVVGHIETDKDLTQINGSTVPVNSSLANAAAALIALGSGPYGTYTMSDFFGCMSGLPYNWRGIQDIIAIIRDVPKEAAVSGGESLYDIYKELYLAVTWERATASVQYTSYEVESPALTFTTWYSVTGVTITDSGGGYGRGAAPAPVVTMIGGSATSTIGTDKTNIGTFGRVTNLNFTPGADTTTVPTISIAFPPGTGSFSNTIVQDYIDQSNAEIAALRTRFPAKSTELNDLWDNTGTQLTIEQRARTIGLAPLPSPRDDNISRFPIAQYSFVDSLPRMALNTEPNMAAQTLEALADMCAPGGQSIVGMMRAARNQARLAMAGIPLDDNISDKLTPAANKELIANGGLPHAGTGPATLAQTRCGDGSLVAPETYGIYNPADDTYYLTNPALGGAPITAGIPALGTTTTIIVTSLELGSNSGTGYVTGDEIIIQGGTGTFSTAIVVASAGVVTGFSSFTPGSYSVGPVTNAATLSITGTGDNTLTVNVSLGLFIVPAPQGSFSAGITTTGTNGYPVNTGKAAEPGSLAGSPYTRIVPSNLNVIYTSDILLPATLTPAEAINEVTACNCDCWVSP